MLAILSVHYSGIEYIHVIAQPLPSFSTRIFHLPTSKLLNSIPLFPPIATDHDPSASGVYEFGSSKFHI